MNIYTDISPLRSAIYAIKKMGLRLALVPTMGNLHAGHLSLVEKAKQCADRVIVSIFVNPLQFGVGEDFASYPRSLEADAEKLLALGVDFVFTPPESLMYPRLSQESQKNTYVSVPELSDELCGVTRPHFFYGITTVLAKLFNIVQPDSVVFGEKDYQQLVIVRRMVADLNFPIEILGMPIVRERDGLAMSSRNQYLNQEERAKASQLYSTLCDLRKKISADFNSFPSLIDAAIYSLNQTGFKVDYISLRNAEDLSSVNISDLIQENREFILLAAVYLGKTRLLDNVRLVNPL